MKFSIHVFDISRILSRILYASVLGALNLPRTIHNVKISLDPDTNFITEDNDQCQTCIREVDLLPSTPSTISLPSQPFAVVGIVPTQESCQ